MNKDYHFMKLALQEAEKAETCDEVPVGVVVVDRDYNIIYQGHNQKEVEKSIFGHAEIVAIKATEKIVGDWRLNDYSMYVTLEPCIMCMASLIHARINKLIFGAYDSKGGAISLNYNFHIDKRLNHNFSVVGGLLASESGTLLRKFFKKKRKKININFFD